MASAEEVEQEILVRREHDGRTAVIQIKREKKLGALTQDHYFRIAEHLHDIAADPNVVITVIAGTGRFFSAGADVSVSRDPDSDMTPRKYFNRQFVANNLHNTHAWYSHPKILVIALNGPVVGITSALIGHADFVYAAPHAYMLVPFTSLGLVGEGAATKALVDRLGMGLANEALLMSRRVSVEKMERCGFVTDIFEDGAGDKQSGKGMDSEKFLKRVLHEVDDKLGPHLVANSLLKIKEEIRKPGMQALSNANMDEVGDGLRVFMAGIPQKEFAAIASGKKRHKL